MDPNENRFQKGLPKFYPKSKGPLTDEGHKDCVKMLGSIYDEINELFANSDHILRGRIQSYRMRPCPCIYVFYDKNTYEHSQSGLMYCLQDTEDGQGFEIVFRKWHGNLPVDEENWEKFGDDRYKVCSSGNWQWKAYQVKNYEEKVIAKHLISIARNRFKSLFSL
jgi:hypothetical protein